MEIKDEYIERIAKYLAGEASENEVIQLLEWVNADPAHAEAFRKFTADWQVHHFQPAEPRRQWLIFSRKTGGKTFVFFREHKRWMRAAAFLVGALLSVFASIYFFREQQKILVAGNQVKTFTLPDGSLLTLAPRSSAVYSSSGFNQEKHSISVSGMAYFDVVHSDKVPFVAVAGKLLIRVMGTKFYVNSGDETTMPTIYLEEGRVEATIVEQPDSKLVILPGQQATIDPQSGKLFIAQKLDPNQSGWLTGHFEFEGTSLFHVLWILQKAFAIQVELTNPGIGNCTLSAVFDKKGPEEILRIIAATLGLELSGKAPHYVLSGNPCP